MTASGSRTPIWLLIRGGLRDGEVIHLDKDRVTIGRSPEADVRFDPELDRAVSTHQAAIAWGESGWFVRDLGSRNGTLVGGVHVEGDMPLHPGSVVSFGEEGPAVVFLLRPPEDAPLHDEGFTQRIRAEVGRETRRLRYLVLALALTLVVVFLASREDAPSGWEVERAALMQFVDSVLRAGDESGQALAGELDDLAAALQTSQEQVRALRRDLEDSQRPDGSNTEALRSELQAATLALQRQQLAAAVDYERIAASSQQSVAAIWVDVGGGEILTGTAFAVGEGLLVTSGHVLSGQNGDRRPERVAVQFSGSTQVLSATPVGASSQVDLALLRITDSVEGPAPLVLNVRPDTIVEGRPVVVIGYPLGGAEPTDVSPARPILSVGLLMETTQREVHVHGYGAEGASGSPVFDERGQVVGVVRGALRDAPVQTLLAVSSVAVRDLVEAVR